MVAFACLPFVSPLKEDLPLLLKATTHLAWQEANGKGEPCREIDLPLAIDSLVFDHLRQREHVYA